jgi:pimeloyl-ACP methyl ester carboxylesterase
LLLILTVHAVAWMIGRSEQPERLGAPIHTGEVHGFRILWVDKRAAKAAWTIVFIHGTPGRAGVWREQFANPFPGVDLVAYDRPGFGASTPATNHPHLQQQVEALTNLLAVVAITNRILLVGHSYGGPIALMAAIQQPDKVAGALLIGADVSPELEKMLWFQFAVNAPLFECLLPRSLRQCNREILAARGDLNDLRNQLPNLSVPIVMLHGARDRLVPVENVAWLESRMVALGKTNLFAKIELPEANHFIPWERPADVAEGIRALARMAERDRKRVEQ